MPAGRLITWQHNHFGFRHDKIKIFFLLCKVCQSAPAMKPLAHRHISGQVSDTFLYNVGTENQTRSKGNWSLHYDNGDLRRREVESIHLNTKEIMRQHNVIPYPHLWNKAAFYSVFVHKKQQLVSLAETWKTVYSDIRRVNKTVTQWTAYWCSA